MRFPCLEIYRAKDGWRWRLKAANGTTIADGGEAYSRKPNPKTLRAKVFTALMRAYEKVEE